MKKIALLIKADQNGRYKTIDVLKQIREVCAGVTFPADKALENTCLTDLRYKNLKCVKGDTVGIINSWSNTNVTYMEREMILYFI